jgi:transposase
MMGIKERAFAPLPPTSLEDLVPADHVSRHLERSLDLTFVRGFVRDADADTGRPSIDPVVFSKLQLILFFEGLRSERQLMRVVADRLSLRWYLGYDFAESLPDHPSLTRMRDRYGLAVVRRFFDVVVEQCLAVGLVWGTDLVHRLNRCRRQCRARFASAAVCRRGAPCPALQRQRWRRR